MNNKLVSIITPCYNGGEQLPRYLDSVLNQTYKNIELIIINDGSIDETEKIINQYNKLFEDNGIKLIYVYQKNKGLGGAINTGLKYFTGEFLCWADCDDFFCVDSIEKRVRYLENNNQYAMVTSDGYIYNEENLNVPIGKITDQYKYYEDEYQFEHHLKAQSIFCCGCHMIRSEAFLDVNPQREIFEARRGQNWQMLLPLYYKYKVGFLNEPLYNYIIYKNSMSQGDDTKEKRIDRYNEHLDIIKNTLARIQMTEDDRHKYYMQFYELYIRDMYNISIKYCDIKLGIKYYLLMIKYNLIEKYDTKSLLKVIILRFLRKCNA